MIPGHVKAELEPGERESNFPYVNMKETEN